MNSLISQATKHLKRYRPMDSQKAYSTMELYKDKIIDGRKLSAKIKNDLKEKII